MVGMSGIGERRPGGVRVLLRGRICGRIDRLQQMERDGGAERSVSGRDEPC